MKLNEKMTSTDNVIKYLDAISDCHTIFNRIPGYDKDNISILYYERSREKTLRELYEDMELSQCSSIVFSKYRDKWVKICNTFLLNYEKLEPYKMNTSDNVSRDNTTKSNTKNSSSNSTSKDGYYAFNSGTESNPVNDNSSNYSEAVSESTSSTNVKTRNISKSGNIGNKSNQELIKDDINLWMHFNFWDIIFADIDRVLCSYIYE